MGAAEGEVCAGRADAGVRVDVESRARVFKRLRKVDAAIGATVYELMREEQE